MSSFISSTMKAIWKRMSRKAYRDGYVSAHVSNTLASQIEALREFSWLDLIRIGEACRNASVPYFGS